MDRRSVSLIACLLAAASLCACCGTPRQAVTIANLATQKIPAGERPLGAVTVDALDLRSPRVVRTVRVIHREIAAAIARVPSSDNFLVDVTLSCDPDSGILTATGPLIPVALFLELFAQLDRGGSMIQLATVRRNDPIATARALNEVFVMGEDVESPVFGGFLAVPARDAVLMFSDQDFADPLAILDAFDRPQNHPSSKAVPMDFNGTNMPVTELFNRLEDSYGVIVVGIDWPKQSVTITNPPPPKDEKESLRLMQEILVPMGYRYWKKTVDYPAPREVLLLRSFSESKRPPHFGINAGLISDKDDDREQIIPLAYLSVISDRAAIKAALRLDSMEYGYPRFRRTSNSVTVSGTDIKQFVRILANLDAAANASSR